MTPRAILAIDQGTTGTTCLVVGDDLGVLGRAHAPLGASFPRPGWVEQDPEEIWRTVEQAAAAALADAGLGAAELAAIGIANQRETTLVWERATGEPVHPAIVWQDRRTADRCAELPAGRLRELTGLVPDPYFSATKLEWLLAAVETTEPLAFGTVDSWLVWKLSGGRLHVTDETNASRTLLAAIATLDWDDELLGLFGVERELLPAIVPSSGVVCEVDLFGATLPLAGIAGDQQAALHAAGGAKATYGTGMFLLAPTGGDRSPPPHGLLRTAAARPGTQPRQYALEGSVFAAGATLQWLRDGLGLLADASESSDAAESVEDNGGVYFVPALAGLGSPHWAPEARGLIAGITGGSSKEHLIRAALEATAYQTRDVLEALPVPLDRLRADGGQTANPFLMQFLADLLGIRVEVPAEREQTALGAALLAGAAVGFWDEPPQSPAGAVYEPRLARVDADGLYAGWREALGRTL